MHSPEHRANMLLPQGQLVGIAALCSGGKLIVVEDFAIKMGAPLPPAGQAHPAARTRSSPPTGRRALLTPARASRYAHALVSSALDCSHISLDLDGTRVLDDVSWEVRAGERWVVLGPNGAGKTTLLRIAALYQHPTSGTVDVLGQRLGRCDVRTLREHIAFSSPALAARLEPSMTAAEVVMTARYAAFAPWWHQYTEADRARAITLLERFRCARPRRPQTSDPVGRRTPTSAAGANPHDRPRRSSSSTNPPPASTSAAEKSSSPT